MKPALVDKTLRKFTIPKLEALSEILGERAQVMTTTTVSGVLTKTGRELGGTLSSLARTNVGDQPLLIQAGRDPEEGVLWKFNENIGSKADVKKLVDQILSETHTFRMAQGEQPKP